MHSKKTLAFALAVAGVVLFGAVAVTAAPENHGKKKGASPAPSKALIAQGKKVFDEKCVACHMVGDKGGKIGPALTHIGKETKEWPAARLAAMVRDPKKTAHTDKMPAFPPSSVSDKDLKALVAYLQSLK